MKKKKNLQPWLDYFEMLQQYVRNGYLETNQEKHEAYITPSALHTLANADSRQDDLERLCSYASVLRRIRAYTGWLSMQGKSYIDRPFAIHVMKDEAPHDILCTVLLTRRRRWWALWCKVEDTEVIDYTKHPMK